MRVSLVCLIVVAALACQFTSEPTPEPTLAPTSATSLTKDPTRSPDLLTRPPNVLLDITVADVPDELPDYDRDDWRHWTDEDRDCQNTRHEVLVEESRTAVEYKTDDQCKVEAGEWYGAYTGVVVTDPTKLDIDHMVPLANAHKSGGWAWSDERKRSYANDLDDPAHLIAVTRGANRMKGAKGPEEWRPSNSAHLCQYALDWISVKQAWELTATPSEASALQGLLEMCENPTELAPTEAVPVAAPTSAKPATQGSGEVYSSCDDAEAAGVQRVQGSVGSGEGFPSSVVPGARDGDGDGVVCEK